MSDVETEDGVVSFDVPDYARMYTALNVVMSKDKGTIADTPSHFGPYPSFNAVAKKVAEIITGSGIGHYQTTHVQDDHVAVETWLTHSSGVKIATGIVRIPFTKKDPKEIASAIGWAKRLSLVSAFGIGTTEQVEAAPKEARAPLDLNFTIKDFSDHGTPPTVAQVITTITGFKEAGQLDTYAASLPPVLLADKLVAAAISKQKPILKSA